MLIPLMILATASAAPSASTECIPARIGEIVHLQPPAVIVLGERKGTQPDLARAERVVSRLVSRGPVTLALESVHRDAQPILDRYADSRMSTLDLPELIKWGEYWGFPWAAYQHLVTASSMGAEVVAVGLNHVPRPEGASLPIPPGYLHILHDAMGDHPVPVELESSFVEQVAWRDHSIAKRAVEQWDEEGWLVILADRLHVQGGQGISWQAARLTDKPVHSYLLADGDARCYPGDRVIRGLFEGLGR